MLGVLSCVLGSRLILLVLAGVFTKVECASLGEVVLVCGLGVNILVVRGVFDRLHEASFQRARGHVGLW